MRLERTNIRSVLGLRFRDAATEQPVTDGLRVTVRHGEGRGSPTRAVRTASGAYAAQGLPGLRPYERSGASVPEKSIPFLVSVEDSRGRYQPVLLRVKLPQTNGLCRITEMPSENGEDVEPTCYLFSAVERPVGPNRAVVYADLKEKGGSKPAAHAVLQVEWKSKGACLNGEDLTGGSSLEEKIWYGVADARGRVAVQFPVPPLQLKEISSSSDGNGSTSTNGSSSNSSDDNDEVRSFSATRCWKLEVKVLYEPSSLSPPPGAERPLLSDILNQAQGDLYPDPGNTAKSHEVTLHYGKPLTLTTGNRTTLRITPDSNSN